MVPVAAAHKNPKVTAAALQWLAEALGEFGMAQHMFVPSVAPALLTDPQRCAQDSRLR
jgi:hypothetical protein